MLQRRKRALQRIDVVLREVADHQVVVAVDLALTVTSTARSYHLWLQRVVQYREEGGLADTVRTQQRDAVAHGDVEGDVLEDRRRGVGIGEGHVRELQDGAVILRERRSRVLRSAARSWGS